ncbi:AIM24 family protein [bacterium]|nr:MAG: AIM24 family protein [bacterium]
MTPFSLPNPRLLRVDLRGNSMMARAGSMVAYDGQVKFDKAILGGEGVFGALKRKATGEGVPLMTCSGTGAVYFAQDAAHVMILPLQNEKLWVESSSLLALDSGLKTNTTFTGLRGVSTGQGLFTTTVEGTGNVAMLSHGTPLELEVGPSYPLFVDPDAFLGYSGQLQQEFIFDINWKTFVGEGSGESFQLKFSGQGTVYIQPNERK